LKRLKVYKRRFKEKVLDPTVYFNNNILPLKIEFENILYKNKKLKKIVKDLNSLFSHLNIIFRISKKPEIYLDTKTLKIHIHFTEDYWIKYYNKNVLWKKICTHIKHELVHKGQKLEANIPNVLTYTSDYEDNYLNYFTSKYEIMAHSVSFVEILRFQGHDDRTIKKSLGSKTHSFKLLLPYFKIYNSFGYDSDEYRTFCKYVYQYVDGQGKEITF